MEKKKRYCVLGHGISYTRSPRVHAVIFDVLGEAATYGVEDIPPERLQAEWPRLMRTYDGFNVTKPHKESAARLLGRSGSVNTVRCDGNCTSTDGIGFYTDYADAFGIPQGNILLLGAGGAAKAVADVLRDTEANVAVYNRTYERALALQGGNVRAVRDASGQYDAVINCTTLGAGGEQAAPDSLDWKNVQFAYDLLYAPPITPFLQRAAEAGAKVRNGLGMLVWQAIAAQEFWHGGAFPSALRKKLYDAVMLALQEE